MNHEQVVKYYKLLLVNGINDGVLISAKKE